MCGIAGFTCFQHRPEAGTRILEEMITSIRSRGPDAEGVYSDDCIYLGHKRLSIIDLEGGKQPMHDPKGRYHLTYNGEIYNFIELRETLLEKGYSFQTESDTEVLLTHLMDKGIEGLASLNGMFAFALWDGHAKEGYLVRDRVGIKPLYYTVCNQELVFASELKALLAYPRLERRLSCLSLNKYLTFGYVPAPNTMYEHVHKLEPGTYLRFRQGEICKQMYWDIPLEENPISGRNVDECADEFVELLEDSIVKRLRSDVPVGVFLSGGLDSSTITALASKAQQGALHTFSVGFEDSSYDESPYAHQVASLFQTVHHHQVCSTKVAVELLPEVYARMDEPFADASILPTYLLCKFASQRVKVVLGGDGGDELFAGYPSFQAHKLMERLSFLPVACRDLLTRAARRIPVSHRYASVDFLMQQFLKGAGISPEIRFFMWMGYFGHEQKKSLLHKDVQHELLRKNPYEDIINYVKQSGLVSDFERILYLCMKLYLQDDILVKIDRASMAHGLEVRVPFLDHHVVEYVSGIKSTYKLRRWTSKYLLKHAAAAILPKNIVHRQKAGFMMPVAKWLQTDLKERVKELFFDPQVEEDGLFDLSFMKQLLDDHLDQRRDNRKQIWNLFCFLIWRKHYGAS